MKTIILAVAPDGTTRVETRGFSGAACQEASRLLEQSLGRVGAETLTTEYHQVESVAATVEHRTTDG